MQSKEFLFNKIKLRIRSNFLFSTNIYYPTSQHIKDYPSIWVNQDNNRIFVCTHMYISYGELFDFELTKEFLSLYTYHEVLRTHCGAYTYKVIYEIQEDNIN